MQRFLESARIRLSPRAWEVRFRLLRERLEGVDFSTTLQPEDVGLDPHLAHRSSPSGNRYLRLVLRDLNIASNDRIIDIGCGKGSAMRVMLDFSFEKVDGIELSDQIAQMARANFRKLRVPPERCRIFAGDATRFSELDAYSHLYFYNPFPSPVMKLFMTNVLASLTRAPRSLKIIYNNPVCHQEIVETGVFKPTAEYQNEWGNEIRIFTH